MTSDTLPFRQPTHARQSSHGSRVRLDMDAYGPADQVSHYFNAIGRDVVDRGGRVYGNNVTEDEEKLALFLVSPVVGEQPVIGQLALVFQTMAAGQAFVAALPGIRANLMAGKAPMAPTDVIVASACLHTLRS